MTTIKITQLTDIGANLASTTVLPVVNMAGTPTTEKTVLGNIANVVLAGAGGNYVAAAKATTATTANTVLTAAQPNITSTGNLTGLTVSNATGVVNFSNTANITLGEVANLHISGGTNGQVLTTNGSNVLSWTTVSSGNSSYGNSNVAAYLPTYTGNIGVDTLVFADNTFQATAFVGTATTAEGLSNVGNATVVVDPLGVNNVWTFGTDGNLNTPGDIVGPANANLTIYANAGVHEFIFGDDGTFYAPDNVVLGGNSIYIGPGANTLNGIEHEVFIASSNLFPYVQAVVNNISDNGSADWVALGARGGDTGGQASLGFTSSGFGDANYTITGNGDGYVLVQSYAPGQTLLGGGGNLVLATGNQGSVKDIIFGTGGFLTANTFGRISHSNNSLELTRTGASLTFPDGSVQTTAYTGGGGGNVSELVNGNNSFVLDSAGNVVFEGTPSGNAVDRGIVWDFGANANGVNSMIRQDNNGLTVRAWTENGGNYTAPVNIITGQDANTNTWRFDGQGNLTVPSGSINSISDGGDLGAYITLTPDLGFAQIAGRNTPANVNYTNTSWSTATYTSTQIDFTNAPDIVAFFTNNTFNVGVNQTISINGDEPIPFTGYSTGASNAVIVYTSVTADPDPTTVTSINFSYQLESYANIDYDAGTLNVNATGLTINIDNDQTSGPDINIRSGDDILLQAKDKALGSESEGGDINILAGDGADDDGAGNISSTGGDIQITAGNGGDGNTNTGGAGGFTQIYGGTGGTAGVANTAGPGGYVSINGGDGGYDNGNTQLGAGGGYVSINAGLSTQEGVNGPNVTITSGQGGPNALAGSVVISTPASVDGPGGDWRFDGYGNLTLPGNTFAVNYANGTPVSIGGGGGNTGNVTFDNVTVQGVNGLNLSAGSDFTANLAYLQVRAGDVASHIHLDTGNNEAYDLIVGDDQNYVQVSSTGNILLSSYDSNTAQYTWTLDYNGNLILAGGNSVIQSIANSSLDILNPNVSTMVLTPDQGYSSQALVLDPTAPGHIHLRAPSQSGNIDIPAANIFLGGEDTSFEVTVGANNYAMIHSGGNTWTFGNDGDLTVPGNLVYIGASPAPSISGFNSVSAEEFTNDTSNVTINANSNTWNFDSTGNLTIPSTSGGFIKTASNASIGIVAMDNGTNNPAQLLSMNVGNGNATSIVSAYSTNVAIQTNASGTINTWKFDNAGNLTLPANTFAINYANGTQVSFSGSNISNGNSNVTIATSAGNVVTNVNAQTILTVYSGGIKVGGSGVLQSPGGATAVTLNNNGANLPIANITNTLNVTGAAGANITSNLVVGGTVTSTGKIGYSVGGNATQSSTGAGVTINQLTGLVTLANRTYNAGDLEAFSISCNKVSNDDFVLVQMVDSVNAPSYNVVAYPNFVLANTISVLVKTLETVGTDTPILKFMIVKAPTA